MEQEQRVALLLDRRSAYTRAMLRGFIKYVRPARRWVIHTWPREVKWTALDRMQLRDWRPMGILAEGLTRELIKDVSAMRVPLVDVSPSPRFARSSYVGVDHVSVGRMVAETFLAQGLRHAAYFGWLDARCQDQLAGLREGFALMPKTTLHPLETNVMPPSNAANSLARCDAFLAKWLCSLPKPLGLMITDDLMAAWLTQPCMQAGLRVPEDVSIIGVNDDETNCQFAHPAVSSVEVPGERVGYEAGRILDELMMGKSPPREPMLFPPVGVVVRQSSDLLAVEDTEVASAVRFIRENAHRPMRVSEVHQAVTVSPRRLEQRFKRALGRTLLAEIQRVHLDRAGQLLAQTNLPLRSIAKRSGFAGIHHLSHAFRRVRGISPSEYRRQFAIGTPAGAPDR